MQYKSKKNEKTMDCKTFRNQVVDLFDKEVSPRTKAECQQHMDECEACRNYYHELSQAAEMLRPKHNGQWIMDNEQLSVANHQLSIINFQLRRRRRVAAVFGGIVLAAGLAASAIHFTQSRSSQPGQKKAEPVHFTQVRLDSILTVVAGHYGQAVVFRDEASRQMQLIMTWNPDAPLDDFVRRLNAFDGLLLTMQHDTLFVEANSADEK